MTAAIIADDHPLRRALLQRLANDLAFMEWIDQNGTREWNCCWVEFHNEGLEWIHCLCDGRVEITNEINWDAKPCWHWHHRSEPPLLVLG
jgi:hypothetical protein